MRAAFLTFAYLLATAVSATADPDPLREQARQLFVPIPEAPPTIPGDPATPARVELGRMLWFEPRLSQAHNISCDTCHLLGLGGADGRPTSIGHDWQRGGRNAPTVLNAVYNTAQFWDGRAADLEEQAGGPIANPVEMALSEPHAVAQLQGIPGYAGAFAAAFPSEAEPITFDNLRRAIAVFEATLVTPDAPFDRWLAGDDAALDAGQRAGLSVFMGKGCAGCHDGINVGGGMYAPFGVVEKPGWEFLPPDDHGRFQVTSTVEDDYVFKVPSLRNVALTAPYFHSGHAWDLRQAVAVMGKSQLGQDLGEAEIDEVTAFLASLTGRQPRVEVPVLPPSTAATPRPEP